MNYKRAIGYGILLWIILFAVISVVMFLPWFKWHNLRIQAMWWILEIPIVLVWAKMYFKQNSPTWKKGLYLSLVALVVGTLLDLIITVPLFVKSYSLYYSSWMLYFGYAELILLCIIAGAEFDGTFTKKP